MDKGKFLMYNLGTKGVNIEVFFKNENIWLTQKKISELFDVGVPAINKHIKNIFEENELFENSVISKMETTASDGKIYKVNYYNLDAIISIGYRVNSSKATKFRIWATSKLKEFMLKGFIVDSERLKNGNFFDKDYFKELLETVRSIRASERRVYQQITDIFAECSIDYDKNSKITKDFYASVQNKFHYAISNKTAAEIIYSAIDSSKINLGLKTWKKAPEGRILKSDTTIVKNYLTRKEIKKLERTVSSFFDYIENIIENHEILKMKDLSVSVDKFLTFNEFKVLKEKGSISKEEAEEKAFLEYDKFNKLQNINSDFDKLIKISKNENK